MQNAYRQTSQLISMAFNILNKKIVFFNFINFKLNLLLYDNDTQYHAFLFKCVQLYMHIYFKVYTYAYVVCLNFSINLPGI